MPLRASRSPDISFSVFFEPGAASLTKEGREIVLVAAKRFAATHNRHSAAQIFVTCETDDKDSTSLSNERIKAVSDQLVRDGIRRQFVSADEYPSVRAEPVQLLEWLDRRVSISIQETPVTGRIVG